MAAEGYYDFENFRYIYQYKDHLGNVRVSYVQNSAGALEIRDTNDYYPFGMSFLKPFGQVSLYDPMAIPYNYKYNGKELQETGMYDYGARFYMPDIGRWGVIDNFADAYHSLSPYGYVANNPIKNIDINGEWIYIYDENNKGYKYDDGKLYSYDEKNKNWNEYTPAKDSFLANTMGLLGQITENDKNSVGSMYLGLFSNDETNANIYKSPNGRSYTKNINTYISFDQKDKVPTTEGNQALTPYVSLFHELGHAFANQKFDRGVLSSEWYKLQTGDDQERSVSKSEVFASMWENSLRSAKDLPLRTYYSPTQDGGTVSDSQILQRQSVYKNPLIQSKTTIYTPTQKAVLIFNEITKSLKK
ncbi:RHS repeat-associated core domain-containing protein [Chryseobacterium sp. SC28]|uniref:RHS repeat-associated core domain-containing protein n=1 Tax=Chryseobacterium sp. SC28 TaxID=2268028 RepID=UPI000F64FCB1|nr:RHS repeat-associated core domain-containing protein [Chryseobacterium sp. SC28]RRQ45495.1 RHS repeat-associated core domain-containing protein [Chryseobacterium sp. SC28]